MYDASPDAKEILTGEQVRKFFEGQDTSVIRSFGLYGGEISEDLEGYQDIIDNLPEGFHRWTITNGGWSADGRARKFLDWCIKNRVGPVIVSGTPWHQLHQDRPYLEKIQALYSPDIIPIRLKGDDIIHSMGRADDLPNTCTMKCKTPIDAWRLAIKPDGDIMFQWCNGDYPIIANVSYGLDRVAAIVKDTVSNILAV